MKKPTELREHLSAWLPDLANNPDKLSVFIERGSIATKLGAGMAFEYRYTLQILITDFAEPVDVLMVPLIAWLHINQPDLLQDTTKRDKAINFDAEILNNDQIDIMLKLELSERVLVRAATGGGYECEHLGEPPLPDLGGPLNWQIYLKGELIAGGPAE